MPFLFGPVLPVELVTTARRRRHYVVRVLYALVLLLVLGTHYRTFVQFAGESLSISEIAEFAHSFFLTFSFTQLTAVLLLTPAYVAPALADEKERRTLEYLFTTDLRNREIVLGKLAVRLGHVFLYVLAGVPILSILRWFGGIPFELLLQMYVLTAMTVIAVGSASMLASVYTRRVREAVVRTYVAGLVWLLIPPLLQALQWSLRRGGAPPANLWLDWVAGILLLTNPYAMLGRSLFLGAGPWAVMGLSVLALSVFSLVCLAIAMLRVRRAYLKQTYAKPRTRTGVRRGSLAARALEAAGLERFAQAVARIRRPPPGEQPIVWKELYAADRVRGGKLAGALATVLGIGFFAWCGWYFVLVFRPWSRNWGDPQEEMNLLLRVAGTAVGMLALLAVAVRAATSVTAERERQTWEALIGTPLEARQVVLGKFAGALWVGRWLLALLLLCWALGVLAGALHPAAVLFMVVELAVYASFLAALGLRFSMGMKRSGTALAWVLGIGLFLGGGYLMCCAPLAFGIDSDAAAFILGPCFPFVVGFSGATPDELADFLTRPNDETVSMAVGAMVMLAVYFGAAVTLVTACVSDFDRLSGRTTGTRHPRPLPPSQGPVDKAS